MNADTALIHRKPPLDRRSLAWLGATAVAIAAWFVIYGQLKPFSEWAVARLPLAPVATLPKPSPFSSTTRPRC
jgi:hypothetical protein